MTAARDAAPSWSCLPMEAVAVEELPSGPGWRYEPKWDGFRCLARKTSADVTLTAKSGKPLARYFPDVAAALASAPVRRVALDGELAIPVGASLSFDLLQARLHPAESRVRKLAAETPAVLILFDCLAEGRRELTDDALAVRRERLEAAFDELRAIETFRLSPYTTRRATAQRWLARSGGALDGVVAKRSDAPYLCGERGMLKVKRLRTADCVVGGFRYATGSRLVGSLLLGLYDEQGRLHHVGFTSGLREDRAALTKRLEALAEPPGFTGDAPGAPSRWSSGRSAAWTPLAPVLVAEVRYDHVTGHRFRHGTAFLRWRPDKAPESCTLDQLEPPRPLALLERGRRARPSGTVRS